jgi:hypothetical protein
MQFPNTGDEFPENQDGKPEFVLPRSGSLKKRIEAFPPFFAHQQKTPVFLISVPDTHFDIDLFSFMI